MKSCCAESHFYKCCVNRERHIWNHLITPGVITDPEEEATEDIDESFIVSDLTDAEELGEGDVQSFDSSLEGLSAVSLSSISVDEYFLISFVTREELSAILDGFTDSFDTFDSLGSGGVIASFRLFLRSFFFWFFERGFFRPGIIFLSGDFSFSLLSSLSSFSPSFKSASAPLLSSISSSFVGGSASAEGFSLKLSSLIGSRSGIS